MTDAGCITTLSRRTLLEVPVVNAHCGLVRQMTVCDAYAPHSGPTVAQIQCVHGASSALTTLCT